MRVAANNIIAMGALIFTLVAAPSNAGEIVMAPIPDDTSVSPKILNGVRADRATWPVTLPFTTDDGGHCTGTVVGDHVVVTAAHCLGDAESARVLLGNRYYNLTCRRHPDYDDRPTRDGGLPCHLRSEPAEIAACTADIAICWTDPPQSIPINVGKFERLKAAPPSPSARQKLTLLGYGCTVAGGPISKVLYVGAPTVRRASTPRASSNPQNSYNEFIETGGPAACNGDSGGAGYSGVNAKFREVVGIISRGNISSLSYLVNVLDSRIVRFFSTISADNKLKICGLDSTATNCIF